MDLARGSERWAEVPYGAGSIPLPERSQQIDRRRRQASVRAALGVAGLGLIVLGLSVVVIRRRQQPDRATAASRGPFAREPAVPPEARRQKVDPATVLAARRLNRAAGVLAFSVLADSGLEHFRGSFENRAMFVAPVVSAMTLAISAHGLADERPLVHRLRHTVYALAGLTGLAGTAFHVYNIRKRPGGFSWLNLFYGAPLGAPGAIALAGLLGFCGERVRGIPGGPGADLFGLPAGRVLAGVTSGGLLTVTGEVWLLHFRGAFHNPAMFAPVILPPSTALLLANAAVGRKGINRIVTRLSLRATALLGFVGAAFHAYGISRNMGGWRNWRQNILNGPPIPAPPSFTGLALAGLAALGLMEDHPDA